MFNHVHVSTDFEFNYLNPTLKLTNNSYTDMMIIEGPNSKYTAVYSLFLMLHMGKI